MKCHKYNTTTRKKNQTKPEQTKRRNYFSNLVLKKYTKKNTC